MPRRKKSDFDPRSGTLVRFNLLSDADYAIARAVVEEIDPLLKRNIMALMEKKLHSVDSFAKYVLRQMIRDGIFCDYNSNMTPLPDGFRLTIEIRLAALNLDIARSRIRQLYRRAFDLTGDLYRYREIEKRLEEESRIAVETSIVEGSLNVSGGSDSDSIRVVESDSEEGEEGSDKLRGADNTSAGKGA